MTDVEQQIRAGDFGFLEERGLIDFLCRQRWFGSKTREIAHATVVDAPLLRTAPPLLAAAIVEVRFHPGTHDLYQVPLGFRPAAEGWDERVVAEVDGWTAYDAVADPELARELLRLVQTSAMVEVGPSAFGFRALNGVAGDAGAASVRLIGAEQSNSSLVFDEQHIMKLYRRLEAGVNPELELLRFLTERRFPNVPELRGWAAYWGRLMDTTLAVLQRFVAGGQDGWALALDSLASDPGVFLSRARRLGEVTGSMHAVLGADPTNPIFAPDEPSAESVALLVATLDEEIDQVFGNLPDLETLDPIRGRAEDVRDQLRLLSHIGQYGLRIRHHGDYHLGQVLWSNEEDWIVLDFEGEPARPLSERRRKRSPLRDVAGMLRSFGYAVSATKLERGIDPPAGWEERARDEFMAGYLPEVEGTGLLPRSHDAVEKLLGVFELEKALYELRYELNHRPDWVRVPVAGIVNLLDAPARTG